MVTACSDLVELTDGPVLLVYTEKDGHTNNFRQFSLCCMSKQLRLTVVSHGCCHCRLNKESKDCKKIGVVSLPAFFLFVIKLFKYITGLSFFSLKFKWLLYLKMESERKLSRALTLSS